MTSWQATRLQIQINTSTADVNSQTSFDFELLVVLSSGYWGTMRNCNEGVIVCHCWCSFSREMEWGRQYHGQWKYGKQHGIGVYCTARGWRAVVVLYFWICWTALKSWCFAHMTISDGLAHFDICAVAHARTWKSMTVCTLSYSCKCPKLQKAPKFEILENMTEMHSSGTTSQQSIPWRRQTQRRMGRRRGFSRRHQLDPTCFFWCSLGFSVFLFLHVLCGAERMV